MLHKSQLKDPLLLLLFTLSIELFSVTAFFAEIPVWCFEVFPVIFHLSPPAQINNGGRERRLTGLYRILDYDIFSGFEAPCFHIKRFSENNEQILAIFY